MDGLLLPRSHKKPTDLDPGIKEVVGPYRYGRPPAKGGQEGRRWFKQAMDGVLKPLQGVCHTETSNTLLPGSRSAGFLKKVFMQILNPTDNGHRGNPIMMIDKISGIGPGYEPRKPEPTAKNQSPGRSGDQVSISNEASRAADVARTAKIALQAEDPTRAAKVAEIKARLQRGEYDNPTEEMLTRTVDRLSDIFFERI